MTKSSKKHLKTTLVLAGSTVASQAAAYRIAKAASSPGQVKVETVKLNFEQKTTQPAQQYSDAAAKTLGVQNQFIFLLALTVLGLVGIFGLIKDFRQR